MGAHLRTVEVPRCFTCRRKATTQLFNRYNAAIGYYCGGTRGHARAALAAALESEREREAGR